MPHWLVISSSHTVRAAMLCLCDIYHLASISVLQALLRRSCGVFMRVDAERNGATNEELILNTFISRIPMGWHLGFRISHPSNYIQMRCLSGPLFLLSFFSHRSTVQRARLAEATVPALLPSLPPSLHCSHAAASLRFANCFLARPSLSVCLSVCLSFPQ